jgi:hypothetical protein
MSDGPGAGQIVGGTFLILFGLCIILVGGGCALIWLEGFGQQSIGNTIFNPWFLVSLATLGAGIVTVWVGVKFLLGKYKA